MIYDFDKYQATGNHFIVMDNRAGTLDHCGKNWWSQQCNQEYGIGADGVLLLGAGRKGSAGEESADFSMTYLNADGGEANLCGNGLRALTHYAFHTLKLRPRRSDGQFVIDTVGGQYYAQLDRHQVAVKMTEFFDLDRIPLKNQALFAPYTQVLYLNTGVPHVVVEVEDIKQFPVTSLGRKMREHSLLAPQGANINFFQRMDSLQTDAEIWVRTYERGVERETLSCGSGALAVALGCAQLFKLKQSVRVKMPGGPLAVTFDTYFENIWLKGEVGRNYWGKVQIPD